MDIVPTWVRLPGLPLPFWYEKHFVHIGNPLGSFMDAAYSFKVTKLKRVAQILVNINIMNGLPGVMKITWKEYSHNQTWIMKTSPFAAGDAMCMVTWW